MKTLKLLGITLGIFLTAWGIAYAASSFCVSGFGQAATNGTYVDTGRTAAGKPIWQNGSVYVCSSGGGAPRWYLGIIPDAGCGASGAGSTVPYYQTTADVSIDPWSVPAGGWTDNGGGLPIGSTAVGACAAVSSFSLWQFFGW